jgi:hypothetical protein
MALILQAQGSDFFLTFNNFVPIQVYKAFTF